MARALVFAASALRRALADGIALQAIARLLREERTGPGELPHSRYLICGRARERLLRVLVQDGVARHETTVIALGDDAVITDDPADPETACVACGGACPVSARTTLTLPCGAATLLVRGIPARACPDCGAAFVGEVVARRIETLAERVRRGGWLAVQEYVAGDPELTAAGSVA